MLTGHPPYGSLSDVDYLIKVIQDSLAFDLNELLPKASEQMKQFVAPLLQIEKEKRPLSAKEAMDLFRQEFTAQKY
jgi:hypothetical protein